MVKGSCTDGYLIRVSQFAVTALIGALDVDLVTGRKPEVMVSWDAVNPRERVVV